MTNDEKKPIPKFWDVIESHLRGMAAVIGALVAVLGAGYGLYTWFNDHFEAKKQVPPAVVEPASASADVTGGSQSINRIPASTLEPAAPTAVEAASRASAAASEAAAQASAAAFDPASLTQTPHSFLERLWREEYLKNH